VTSLDQVGIEYFDPSFTKVVMYSHGRAMNLAKQASNNRFLGDAFCRKLTYEDSAEDYTTLFRSKGYNVFAWWWAQYSWSPSKQGTILESGEPWGDGAEGTEVSPKIWADAWVRRNCKQLDSEDAMASNPRWAKFSDASQCIDKEEWDCPEAFEWTKTETNKDDYDVSLAIGNVLAESLLTIAPSYFSNVNDFHLVGNSYGTQVVLHATHLVLEKKNQLDSCLGQQPISAVPVPSRLVLVDPVYKQYSCDCGWFPCWNDPILQIAEQQLQAINNYGISTLKLDATALANFLPGTINTGPLNYNAATAHVSMYGASVDHVLAHTEAVDWYFRTYFPDVYNTNGGDGSCSLPGAVNEAIMLGCSAEADARSSFSQMVNGNDGVYVTEQTSDSDVDPWRSEWKKELWCSSSSWWSGCDQAKRGNSCRQ